MYSGGNVDVFSGSSLTLQDGLLLNGQLKVPSVLVSKGDINLPGGSSASVLKQETEVSGVTELQPAAMEEEEMYFILQIRQGLM